MAEAERVKPRGLFVEEAIALALENRWAEALEVNQHLVEKHGPDEDSYNRQGKALTELGRYEEAIGSYGRALELNPTNPIAQKNTRKLALMLQTKERLGAVAAHAIDVDLFTEEPGKSSLTLLAPPKQEVTVSIAPGDVVELEVDKNNLHARTARGVLLGQVDSKLARRLMPLMKSGNRYSAAVARVEDEGIEIMVREEYQAPENLRKSSFPISVQKQVDYRPYAKESLRAARGTDAEPLNEDEDEVLPAAVRDDEDLEGMRTLEGDFDDDVAVVEEDDDEEDAEEPDEDVRPEDQM